MTYEEIHKQSMIMQYFIDKFWGRVKVIGYKRECNNNNEIISVKLEYLEDGNNLDLGYINGRLVTIKGFITYEKAESIKLLGV